MRMKTFAGAVNSLIGSTVFPFLVREVEAGDITPALISLTKPVQREVMARWQEMGVRYYNQLYEVTDAFGTEVGYVLVWYSHTAGTPIRVIAIYAAQASDIRRVIARGIPNPNQTENNG